MFNSKVALSSQQYGLIHEKYEKDADKRIKRVSQKIWKSTMSEGHQPNQEDRSGAWQSHLLDGLSTLHLDKQQQD